MQIKACDSGRVQGAYKEVHYCMAVISRFVIVLGFPNIYCYESKF